MMSESTAPSTRAGWTTHIDVTKRGLAKLLARENVTVRHADAPTASFNLETRVLTLPLWTNITADQYDLLIGHEVGHAKYSDDIEALSAADMTPGLHSYINVIEDARIERKMKEEFPGLRGSFRRGYADFFENGPIFQLDKPAADYTFIDRVNMFYKIGAHVDVAFSATEQSVLPRIDALRTMSEAIALARELYTAERNRMPKPKPSTSKQDPSQGQGRPEQGEQGQGEQGEGEQGEGQPEQGQSEQGEQQPAQAEQGQSEQGQSEQGQYASGEQAASEPVAQTETANAAALETLAAPKKEYNYSSDPYAPAQLSIGTLPDALQRALTVSNSAYRADVEDFFAKSSAAKTTATAYLAQFMTAQRKTIAHLASEFDRKKSAALASKSKTSRTGALDVTKLYAYKFRDDLFKSIVTTPNGQSHGVVLLIDGSGSMAPVMSETLDQVLLFASFAKRVNIPFQAYVFGLARTEDLLNGNQLRVFAQGTTDQVFPSSSGGLLQLIDSTAGHWNEQLLTVAAFAAKFDGANDGRYTLDGLPYSQLGMTPLAASLLTLERHVANLKRVKKLDKMTVIVLTDGDSSDSLETSTDRVYRDSPMVIRDTVTRKTYSNVLPQDGGTVKGKENSMMAMLVDVIRQRHSARVVGIRIASNRTRRGQDLNYTLDRNSRSFVRIEGARDRNRQVLSDVALTAGSREWSTNGQFTMNAKDTYFDGAIIVNPTRLELVPDTFATADTTKMTARQIIKSFVKQNLRQTANRVFVNAVLPHIA